ncbi:type VI secretion system contractile sheath domain-containing protein [Parasulfitobacter algicola]
MDAPIDTDDGEQEDESAVIDGDLGLDEFIKENDPDQNSDATSQDEDTLDISEIRDEADSADDTLQTDDETVIDEPFGTMSAERPADLDQISGKFRIAILGDFSGRASRGNLEIGQGLANRKPIKFDVDSLDSVISRFATTLVLPIGNDGTGVEVKLNEIDDLHPDELYENVAIFEELSALRQQVAMGDGTAAIADMQGWAGDFGGQTLSSRKRAKGNAVPADRKLSAFQALIGDMQGQLAKPSPASELIGRIVGPYVQAAPDPAQDSMLTAIDAALSGAMRAILHHPDFQTFESTWRSLELLARRVNTGADLEIVLYDVSAEEWAADLSAQDDLAESGLFQMLAEEPRLDDAQGPLSAVFGLYTLEETPPHAELLARMSKISAWMNAPFMTAISPKFLETPKHERHPLVRKTWDALCALPEAQYIGLAAPRFLLRLPYGQKTEPVDPFEFEEFDLRSGLKGMLWANPVVLSAILMAETVNQHGKKMRLGQIMSLDDMPFHYMTDQYGDQIALPCTERLLNTRTTADVVARGFIPLLSMKGRNQVRQGSFQALGASELAGPWGQSAGSTMTTNTSDVGIGGAAKPDETPDGSEQTDGADEEDTNVDFSTMDTDDDLPEFDHLDDDDEDSSDDDIDLDDLLAGFDDDDQAADDDDDDEELDPELAALLEGL